MRRKYLKLNLCTTVFDTDEHQYFKKTDLFVIFPHLSDSIKEEFIGRCHKSEWFKEGATGSDILIYFDSNDSSKMYIIQNLCLSNPEDFTIDDLASFHEEAKDLINRIISVDIISSIDIEKFSSSNKRNNAGVRLLKEVMTNKPVKQFVREEGILVDTIQVTLTTEIFNENDALHYKGEKLFDVPFHLRDEIKERFEERLEENTWFKKTNVKGTISVNWTDHQPDKMEVKQILFIPFPERHDNTEYFVFHNEARAIVDEILECNTVGCKGGHYHAH